MTLTGRAQIFLVLLLVVGCFVFYFIFEGILPCYFAGASDLHIIDIHLKQRGLRAFIDVGYIATVKSAYNAERYKDTFFLVDLLFAVTYTSLFLALSYVFRSRRWHKWVHLMYFAGLALDLGENGAFLYYLCHSSNLAAFLTAFCTTFKSLLFPLNIGLSLVLFVRGFFVRKTDA